MSAIKNHRACLITSLKDPARAAAYLNEALALGDTEIFLDAIRDVIVARCEDIDAILERIDRNDKSHSPIISIERNPELGGVDLLLDALGFKAVIEVKKSLSNKCH